MVEVARTSHLNRLKAQITELNKNLLSEKKRTSDQRKQIKRLEKQKEGKIRELEQGIEKYAFCFETLKKDYAGNPKLAMKLAG